MAKCFEFQISTKITHFVKNHLRTIYNNDLSIFDVQSIKLHYWMWCHINRVLDLNVNFKFQSIKCLKTQVQCALCRKQIVPNIPVLLLEIKYMYIFCILEHVCTLKNNILVYGTYNNNPILPLFMTYHRVGKEYHNRCH